jgi:hypothetical protein
MIEYFQFTFVVQILAESKFKIKKKMYRVDEFVSQNLFFLRISYSFIFFLIINIRKFSFS